MIQRLLPALAPSVVIWSSVMLAGCPGPVVPEDMGIGCTGAYLGDPERPMELELFYLGSDLLPHDLPACGPLDIVAPPQGGFVTFVGVRATNLDPCNAKMAAGLRDPRDQSLLGLEARSTIFAPIAGRPGWGATSAGGDSENGYRYVANIPACPNMSSDEHPRDIPQEVTLVDILITDQRGKKAEIVVRAVPRCAQATVAARAFCNCSCQANYTGGKCTTNGGGPVTTFPERPDAGACFPVDVDGGSSDGAARD